MTDLRTRWLRVDGRRVRLLEAGSGPPLVIVPGLGLSGDFYRSNLSALAAAGSRAMAVDLPGFGRSEANGRTGMSVEETAAWLERFARTLGLAGSAWLGHSVSCQALIELAARAPHLVRALILAAPTGARRRGRAGAQLLTLARDAVHEPAALLGAVARDYLRTSPFRYIGAWLRAARHDPLVTARHVRCPCLVVGGERDPVVGRRFLDRVTRKLPDGRLTVLAGGHGLPFDAAEAFSGEVARFLRSVEQERRAPPAARGSPPG